MKKYLYIIVVLIIIFIICYNYYLELSGGGKKAEALKMLSCTEILKENNFQAFGGSCQNYTSNVFYSKDGKVILYNKDYDLSIIYIPKDLHGKIEWLCIGSPKKYFPACSGYLVKEN